MWSKLSNALKRNGHEDSTPEATSSQGDVMSKVFEQHPNLSVFHNQTDLPVPTPSPPSSPSKHGRRGMFKRTSRIPKDDADSLRSPSPFQLPVSLPKKVRSTLNLNGNNSQLSLSRASADPAMQDIARKSSQDMLRPSRPSLTLTTTQSSSDTMNRRASQDLLRGQSTIKDSGSTFQEDLNNPLADPKYSSVRSILRDPNTPGTGQNVRFFSRDAYKVISPDQSVDNEFQPLPSHPQPLPEETFLDRLQRVSPNSSDSMSSSSVMPRSTSHSKARPSVTEVFSPLNLNDNTNAFESSPSLAPIPPPDFTNLFDMSQHMELSAISAGAGAVDFDPMLDDPTTSPSAESQGNGTSVPINTMTSTPYRKTKGKGKEKEPTFSLSVSKEDHPIDETIFHSMEKSPALPAALHDRSQSFSFGQTVFYSVANNSDTTAPSPSDTHNSNSSSNNKHKSQASDTSSVSVSHSHSKKNRSRALSDTVFQAMIRSSPNKPPEADINDESSSDLVVYSSSPPSNAVAAVTAKDEPDPFSANANTYYTPQTMIPVTPPRDSHLQKNKNNQITHARKTSKEESIIFSLQTQLALQRELAGQYEADLLARDELVDILSKRLTSVEAEDSKRRGVLRAWKKKVGELERACRYLEEEVEGSRQESMERSVMDEASGEALRMLHRRIGELEREKVECAKREDGLRRDVERLEETLLRRDERERELQEGIREAKEQMEMMGNVSIGALDEEDLKRLAGGKEEEKEKHRAAENRWEEETAELRESVDRMTKERENLRGELESVRQQLRSRDEEFGMLKKELEAQWQNTEKDSEKIADLVKERDELKKERDTLKEDVEDLEAKIGTLEVEWNESENKRSELESQMQEIWNTREAAEKDRDEIDDQLHQEQEHAEALTQALQEREDRISSLEQEQQYATDSITRLEDNIRQRDLEVAEYSEQIVQREAEAEALREQMAKMQREHSRVVDEQSRALNDVAGQEGEARMHMEVLVKEKAEADVEMRTLKERVSALKDEVERLRRQVHELQQESADKEVKMAQINKQRNQDKEDMQGLNIALDSKQQELELLKRRLGVRGTAGTTPAQPSKTTLQRRDSQAFTATPVASRPSSVMSDGSVASKERKLSTESAKIPALGKNTRVSNASTTGAFTLSASLKAARGIEGSMGPPPAGKPRVSMATPTPSGSRVPSSSLGRSSSARPSGQTATPVPASHRRGSSANMLTMDSKSKAPTSMRRAVVNASPAPSASLSEQDEKENVEVDADVTPSSRRRSMIPTPA